MEELKQKLESEEKKNQQISFAATTGLSALLLFLSMFWVAFAGMVPPIEEQKWKTVGYLADFGNMKQGSKKVNNFRKPSEKPADKPKADPKPVEKETPVKPKVSTPVKNVKSTTASKEVVTEVKTKPVVKPKTEPVVKPKVTPKTEAKTNPTPTKSTPKTTPTKANSGGSNDGNSNTTGNKGHPDSKVLNEKGMFKFGKGIGGSGGRVPLGLPLPKYDVKQEAKITYTFVIAPSGEVIYVKPEWTTHTQLAKIGADAIKKWRFSEIEEGSGNLRTTVTITFRLE